MRKIKYYISVFLTITLVMSSAPANAQLVAGVSFDFLGDAAAAITPVFEQAQTVKDQVIVKVREKITSFKASLSKYFKKRKNVAEKVPGTKGFAEDSSVDIYDYDAVKAAFTELFLQYPSDKKEIKDKYELMAQNFYYDTIVEIYTASKQMEKQLDSLREDRDNFASGLLGDKGSASGDTSTVDPEDQNANYYNLYIANKKFNDIIKLTQEVMAMYAQYYAAYAVYTKAVLPAPYDDEADEESGKDSGGATTQTSSIRFKENIAFAQMLKSSSVMSEAAEVVEENKNLSSSVSGTSGTSSISAASQNYLSSRTQPKVSKIPMTKLSDMKIETEMYKSLDKMEALGELARAQNFLDRALRAHNALQLLPSYKELYVQYDLYKQLHNKSVEVLGTSDQCVIQYLGRRYKTPETVWYGQSAAPKILNDYDNRRGLSGWTVTAFQVTNAEKSSGLNVESFGMVDFNVDYENNDLGNDPVGARLDTEDSDKYALSSPSKEAEFADTIRDVELVTFQIGSQAAKILAADMYSPTPVFGNAYNKYPVWEDQKSFYNQYLEGKYKNMRSYIRKVNVANAALGVANLINDGIVDDVENPSKAKNTAALNRLKDIVSNQGADDNSVTAIQNNKKAALAKLDKEEAVALAPHNMQLETLNDKLDNISLSISYTNEQITDAGNAAHEAKLKAENAHDQIVKLNSRDPDSGLRALAQSEFKAGTNESLAKTTTAGQLRVEVKKLETQREAISAEIEKVNTRIESIKQSYILGRNSTEETYNNMIKAMEESGNTGVITLRGLAGQYGITGGVTLNAILSSVDSMVGKARDSGEELIRTAENEIIGMGDSLYETTSHSVVINRHKQLISGLKTLSASQFSSLARTALGVDGIGLSGITSAMSGIFRAVLVNNICSGSVCDVADGEYFVGVPSKARDFHAPKSPFSERYAHVRDIVHFDLTDYKSVGKASGGVITRDSFLNSGGQFPQIWKQILSEKPFVEKTIDLSRILSRGGEDRAYMRGNMYPCRIGAKVIDVDNSSAKYVVSENILNKTQDMPVCLEITLKGILGFYTTTDIESDESASAGKLEVVPKINPSELGIFLKYQNNRLMFNNQPRAAFENGLSKENEAKKRKAKYKLSDIIYEKTMFTNNQIGNFLHFVDKELNIRKSVEEIRLSIDEASKDLREILVEMGFDPGSNINLANDNEYQYIVKKLESSKATLLGSATSVLSTISTGDSLIDEVYNKANNTRAALVQDSNETVSLNTSTKSGNSLAEEILAEKANKKVIEKAQQEGYDAIRKEIKNFEIPMCVVY